MKKIRLALFFAFFSLFSIYSIFPQNSKNPTIDEICAFLTSNKVTSGDFIQEKISPKLSRPLISSGKFIFCSKGVVWAAEKPFKTSTVITENSIIQTGLNGKKQVIDGSSNEIFKSVAQTLSSLFTGNKNQIETYFTIQDFTSDSSSWKMTLIPKDKTISAAIQQIALSGDVKNQNLNSMKIIQSGSSSTNYILSNQIYAQELSDEQENFFK